MRRELLDNPVMEALCSTVTFDTRSALLELREAKNELFDYVSGDATKPSTKSGQPRQCKNAPQAEPDDGLPAHNLASSRNPLHATELLPATRSMTS